MIIAEIAQLMELFEKSSLSLLDVSEGELKIRLERGASAPAAAPVAPPADSPPAPEPAVPEAAAVNFNELKTVRSPLVGVFYAAPAPDAKPYVSVGSHVRKGDVLCIIEAMKLFNEITAECDGDIVDICVENGQLVEYAQELFKIF
ncbi:MAG: acetyl-CoA carboxylase biotin carboxyl carrier protein [Clostridiales bacterium]|nr:acetyl-CoA carboxylase biotin carboxyl carrier protein [Clostridiales bacterium]